MTLIHAKVHDQVLVATILPKMACNSHNTVKMHVDFDSTWNGYTKTALFYTSSDPTVYPAEINATGECVIPAEVLATAGYLCISVQGIIPALGLIKTTTLIKYKILPGTPSLVVSDPSPSIYQQLLTACARIDNIIAHNNDTEGNTELIDIRTGLNGVIYPTAGAAVRTQFSNFKNHYVERKTGKNLFNKNSDEIVVGKYIGYDDGLTHNAASYEYLFIEVEQSTEYTINWGYFHLAYFSGDTYLKGVANPGGESYTFTTPERCNKIAFSVDVNHAANIQIERGTKSTDYENYEIGIKADDIRKGSITEEKLSESLRNKINDSKPIVEIGAGKAFSSILEALIANSGKAVCYKVYTGIYDIEEEYTAHYGANYFDQYAGYLKSNNLFDRGLYLCDGTELIGVGDVNIIFNYAGDNALVHEFFSPLNTSQNNVVDNINISIADRVCRYGIHDDFATEKGTNIFQNCLFEGISYLNTFMGCGMGKENTYIIQNCIFLNAGELNIAYHNNANAGAKNKLIIKDCYCDGSIRGGMYGYSKEQSLMIASGNTAKRIYAELTDASNFTNENIRLIAFNNVLRTE